MRRALALGVVAALMLIVLPVGPVGATPDRPETIEVFDWVNAHPTGGNPCFEGDEGFVTNVGEVRLHALPSVEAFWAGAFTHATWWFTFHSTDEQGYTTPTPGSYMAFVNQRFGESGEPQHSVSNTVANIIYSGEDGGRYRVHLTTHVTLVDGEPKVEFEVEDAVCLMYPES